MSQKKRIIVKWLVAGPLIVAAILGALLSARGGSLTPSAAPATTMKTLADIDAVIEGSFNAATTTANVNGNAAEILKCVTTRITGGAC